MARKAYPSDLSDKEWLLIEPLLLFSKIVEICQRLTIIWADGGYRRNLLHWVKEHFSWTLEIVLRSDKPKGFIVLPERWIVERTNAWLGQSRRLNRQ